MKRRISRFSCWLMAFVMCFSLCTPAFAISIGQASDTIDTDLQNVALKVSFMLPLLCEDLSENCVLGEKLSSYVAADGKLSPTEYEIYPVMSGGRIVALAQVTTNEAGVKTVSCITGYASELQKFYNKNTQAAIAIAFACDGVYILRQDNSPLLVYEANYTEAGSISDTVYSKNAIKYNCISNAVAFSAQESQTRSIQFNTLSVPFVANNSVTPDCGNCDIGLCWAACMAMIVNYYRGTSYDAFSMHEEVGCLSYVLTPEPYHTALRSLGLYTSATVFWPLANFTYSDLYAHIEANRLMLMRMERPDVSGSEGGHFIVPCAYYWDTDSNYKSMSYKDPNHGGCVTEFPESGRVSISSAGHNYNFSYYITAYW